MTILRTKRFLLRPIESQDAPRFAVLCNDIDIARNTARVPHPYGLADAEAFVKAIKEAFETGQEYAFAVCREGEIIACAGTMPAEKRSCEIGYWVGAEYRRNGVATEIAAAVTQFSFDQLGAETVTAGHFTDNPASGRVLTKLGFLPTGKITQTMSRGRGCAADTVRLTLSHAAFRNSDDVRAIID